MEFEEEFPCPIYAKAWDDLLAEIDEAKHLAQKICIYANFAEKYTLLPRYWSYVLEGIRKINNREEENGENVEQEVKSSDRYYYLYSPECVDRPLKHIEFKYPEIVMTSLLRPFPSPKHVYKQAEKYLNFPHHLLYDVFEAYMSAYPKPVSKDVILCYKKNKNLYSRILKCGKNLGEWLECIKEIEDKEAVIANFELKLGQDQNWTNKKLWDAYIKFLKENNRKEILEVYRKYTRLFISDKEAVEEYRNKIEKFSSWNKPTTKYWFDTIKYEMDFGNLKFAYCLLKRGIKAVLGRNVNLQFQLGEENLSEKLSVIRKEMEVMEFSRETSKISIPIYPAKPEPEEVQKEPAFFTTENSVKQNFPFRRSFIQHLLKTANALILKKLFETCKFFFSVRPIALCYHMEISFMNQNEIWREGIVLDNGAVVPVDNLHLYGRLRVNNIFTQTLLSAIIQKLYRCDAYSINITYQNISFNEYQFLLSDSLVEIRFTLVTVYDQKEDIEEAAVNGMTLFEMAKKCPKLEIFELITELDFIVYLTDTELNCFKSFEIFSFAENQHLENIYIDGKDLTTLELQKLVNDTELKKITIQNVDVENENGYLMNVKEVVEFLEPIIPSNASICVVTFLQNL